MRTISLHNSTIAFVHLLPLHATPLHSSSLLRTLLPPHHIIRNRHLQNAISLRFLLIWHRLPNRLHIRQSRQPTHRILHRYRQPSRCRWLGPPPYDARLAHHDPGPHRNLRRSHRSYRGRAGTHGRAKHGAPGPVGRGSGG